MEYRWYDIDREMTDYYKKNYPPQMLRGLVWNQTHAAR